MANLSKNEKQILESLFRMEGGGVLRFSHKTLGEFFRDDVELDNYAEKYNYETGSKADRMRGLWSSEDNKTVGKVIAKLLEHIEFQILLRRFHKDRFPEDIMQAARKIAERLLGEKVEVKEDKPKATFQNGTISITLQKDVFDHVQELLNDEHYYNAVEEAYKVVREKLKAITGKEKATSAFSEANYGKIFGHQPKDEAEKDFFEGVKFLHMAIQFLRNEKSHTPAYKMDKNSALHYIALASLAYDLITRAKKDKNARSLSGAAPIGFRRLTDDEKKELQARLRAKAERFSL